MTPDGIEHDPAERLSADDMATRREEEFRAVALRLQRQAAIAADLPGGVCANCGAQCLPQLRYCDADCRADHEARAAVLARQGRRA